jgi:hypothetical protein
VENLRPKEFSVLLPLSFDPELDRKNAQHTQYGHDNSYHTQQAQIFKRILPVPEKSEEAKKAEEEQLPWIVQRERHKSEKSQEAQESVYPESLIIFYHNAIMPHVFFLGKSGIEFTGSMPQAAGFLVY